MSNSSEQRHNLVEDVFGLITGTFVAGLGVSLLNAAGVVTGGTVGLSLLASYASGLPFALLNPLITAPFLLLAWWKRGASFALRSLAAVVLLSLFAAVHSFWLSPPELDLLYGTLVGNVLAGVGMVMLFRHNSSLGGTNTLALLVHQRLGWSTGWVQMTLDGAIVLGSALIAPWPVVAISALGVVTVNIVLVLNHRPGRYTGWSN